MDLYFFFLDIGSPFTDYGDCLKQASEIAIRDTGYSSPDHGLLGIGSTKSDVFAFGVLLLELLTGSKPFDGYVCFLIHLAAVSFVSSFHPLGKGSKGLSNDELCSFCNTVLSQGKNNI